ncbi:MAG TPA: transaldolase [bacterium]|jgi:transaldolase
MSHPTIQKTLDLGQSIWLDFISRDLMNSGKLQQLIDNGLRGETSNPTIFEKSISKSGDYDPDIHEGHTQHWTAPQIFEHIAVTDVTRACDALRPVYDITKGTDGFVSIEVSPGLANDTDGTITEARRLWKSVNRPNLMVKIPGTDAGIPAIAAMLAEGLNINITLLFSQRQYHNTVKAWLDGLEERVRKGQDVSHIASVASFFVSRVDTAGDKLLEAKGRKDLMGKAAIANACLAYKYFLEMLQSPRWKALEKAGAHVQRPLWASTSTKNPDYPDVLYVTELMAKDTVNTLPLDTIEAWMDHGKPEPRLLENLKTAEETLKKVHDAGVDVVKITEDLIEDGVVKFTESFNQLMAAIEKKVHAEAVK